MASFLSNFVKTDAQVERNAKIEAGRSSFREYCNLINPDFFRAEREYQDILCNTLQAFHENKLINPKTKKPYKILLINLPPDYGKTYTVSLFVTWFYGQRTRNQVISVKYDQTLSNDASRTIRELIDDEEIVGDDNFVVNSFFPKLKTKHGDAAVERWSLEGSYSSFLATTMGGRITGFKGDMGIIDDPVKNEADAVNEAVKAKHFKYYKNTFRSRIRDGGKQIVIQTRWATDDLSGKLLEEFPDKVFELKMTALVDDGAGGVKSLCEDLYSLEDLLDKKATLDEHIWLANYMQEPIDILGALYGDLKTYDVVDRTKFERTISYTDTADEGADYLCQIIAGVIGRYAYELDVYYTDEPMEVTEKEAARRLHLHGVREAMIESNNGGRGFARNVIRLLRTIFKNKRCNVTWFFQSKNKRTRILVNSSNVKEQLIMSENWKKKYPKFSEHISKYQRKGKNTFHDAPDTATGIVEMVNGEVKGTNKVKVLKRSNFGI